MKVIEYRNAAELLAYLKQVNPADTPQPVHVRDTDFDSANGRAAAIVLPAGLSYPALTAPSRAKAGIVNDADPVPGTNGTILTEYNQCRFFLLVKDAGAAEIPTGSATVTIWHRGRPGIEDGTTVTPGPWLKGATVHLVGTRKEIIDTQLYHREVYLQLTDIAGVGATDVDVFICGIEDSEFQQPLMFTPGGSLEAHLTGVNIEGANLEVQLEANPDDPGEEADSIILASTLNETLPVDPSNLAPPVMPIRIDRKGRYVVEGTAGAGALAPATFPQVVAGHHSVGAVYATMTTALGVVNAELVWAAIQPGVLGNNISVAYVDGGPAAPLTIGEAGGAITVTFDLAAATVTANMVRALVEADARIWSLVHVENAPANDGTGLIIAMGAAPLIGGAGVTRVVPLALGAAGGMEVVIEAIPDSVGEKADSIVDCSTIDHTVPSNVNLAPPVASLHIDADGKQTSVGYEPHLGLDQGSFPHKMAGIDYAGVHAALTTALAGVNNDLVFTAVKAGPDGNAVTIEYVDGGVAAPTAVVVIGSAISVLGDIGAGVTSQAVMDIVNLNPYARMLVTVEHAAGNDGTGTIIVMAPNPLIGGTTYNRVYAPKVLVDGTAIVGGETPAGVDYTLPLGEENTACGTRGLPAMVRGHFGLPTVLGASARDIQMLGDPYGRPRVIIDNYRTEVNDSIKNRPIIPEQILVGGTTLTSGVAVGNTLILTAVSTTLKYGVWMRVSPKFSIDALIGAFCDSANFSIIDAGGLPVAGFMFWRSDPGLMFIPVDNASKIYVASDTLFTPIIWGGI